MLQNVNVIFLYQRNTRLKVSMRFAVAGIKNLPDQGQLTTTSTHIWRRRRVLKAGLRISVGAR